MAKNRYHVTPKHSLQKDIPDEVEGDRHLLEVDSGWLTIWDDDLIVYRTHDPIHFAALGDDGLEID